MKKILWIACLFLFSLFPLAYAGGGITHMFLAEESIKLIPDPQLRNLLMDNLDAYRVGAYYPDSGYIKGNEYGEDSHWDAFIYAFANHIKEAYPDFIVQNPKLVAFLFGCAAHRVSDEIMHWTFYPVIRDKDFNGDGDAAHSYGDTGIDLLVNIDKNLWTAQPTTWWVPVKDLVHIYRRMGKDTYSAEQIVWGNSVISVAGYGERLISAPSYPYLKWKMSWTAAHYYDWPQGGIVMDEHRVADYQMKLWKRLQSKTVSAQAEAATSKKLVIKDGKLPDIYNFAENALKSGIVGVTIINNPDGSVELGQPVIKQEAKFQQMLNQLIAKIIYRQ